MRSRRSRCSTNAPLPNAFPYTPRRSASRSELAGRRPSRSASHLVAQFAVDPNRATYSAQTAVVVRIRDGDGHPVQTLSQQYLLTGDAKDLEAAKKGEILFYREAQLKVGIYTIESIVFDAAANRGSARVSTLTVPAYVPFGFTMSSLVLVSRAEDVADGAADASPLKVGKTLLYPNLGEPIVNAPSRELPFFFTMYGDVGARTASVQLLRNGQVLAEAPVTLASPTGTHVQHVGRFPIGALPPGTYELRIRVGDLARSAFFTLR
jgi:hypothetical protein